MRKLTSAQIYVLKAMVGGETLTRHGGRRGRDPSQYYCAGRISKRTVDVLLEEGLIKRDAPPKGFYDPRHSEYSLTDLGWEYGNAS